jgi:ribosome biogenesis protein UTP30
MASKLDTDFTAKAIHELFKYEDKQERNKQRQSAMGPRPKPIYVQVQLKDAIKKAIVRPVRVKIPHSLFSVDEDDHSVCLFCKSEDVVPINEYLKKNTIDGLTKVVSIGDMKKRYSNKKDKKMLLGEHSHFLCDTSIVTQIYGMLGKTFTDHSLCPVPISFKSPENIQDAMIKVITSSYMHLKGKAITIRVGLTSMSEDEVTENTLEGLEFAIAKFKNTWKDVHSIHLKTSTSPALPIYTKMPSEVLSYIKRKAEVTAEQNLEQLFGILNDESSLNESSAEHSISIISNKKRKPEVVETEIILSDIPRPKTIKRIKSATIKRA